MDNNCLFHIIDFLKTQSTLDLKLTFSKKN